MMLLICNSTRTCFALCVWVSEWVCVWIWVCLCVVCVGCVCVFCVFCVVFCCFCVCVRSFIVNMREPMTSVHSYVYNVWQWWRVLEVWSPLVCMHWCVCPRNQPAREGTLASLFSGTFQNKLLQKNQQILAVNGCIYNFFKKRWIETTSASFSCSLDNFSATYSLFLIRS